MDSAAKEPAKARTPRTAPLVSGKKKEMLPKAASTARRTPAVTPMKPVLRKAYKIPRKSEEVAQNMATT